MEKTGSEEVPGKGRIAGERRRQRQEKCQKRGEVQGKEKYRVRRNAREGGKYRRGKMTGTGEVPVKKFPKEE